ncbi:putative ribosomal protein S5 domain 2-type [Helianthus debilis subsp. tardiflorus]
MTQTHTEKRTHATTHPLFSSHHTLSPVRATPASTRSSFPYLFTLLSPSAMVGLSVGEKHFIQGGIAQDLRTDGRKRLTYRPIFVETGVIAQANGSARVKMGKTEVIASVKAELGRPSSSAPDKGKVSIFVDCSPTAAPQFEVSTFIIFFKIFIY